MNLEKGKSEGEREKEEMRQENTTCTNTQIKRLKETRLEYHCDYE